jgi:DNA-binding MarR family transcriptional regulator
MTEVTDTYGNAENDACNDKTGGNIVLDYKSDLDFDQYLPYRLTQLQLLMYKVVDPGNVPEVRAIEVLTKTECRVLAVIAVKGPIQPSSITEVLSLDRAVITRVVSKLTRTNMVDSIKNVMDGRSKLVGITVKGAEFCDRLLPVMNRFGQYLDNCLTVGEKKTLLKIMEKLSKESEQFSGKIDLCRPKD